MQRIRFRRFVLLMVVPLVNTFTGSLSVHINLIICPKIYMLMRWSYSGTYLWGVGYKMNEEPSTTNNADNFISGFQITKH